MITRAQYMERSGEVFRAGGDTMAVHREYYAQFVNDQTISHVVRSVGAARLLASTDPHLNDIPLQQWDALCGFRRRGSEIEWFSPHSSFPCNWISKELGTWMSPSDLGCIAKEAARQWIERQEA
ncbi:MAG: hypothetical protein K0Q89_50 [Thermomicrobiales bacterium]|jgi:hypothetical protein|nr:hypothetical protein [Thermomicrobiales bacterium]